MATVFNYFYIGEQTLYSNELNLQPPTLLTFSKIQNGAKGETLPHLHTYLELFYFEKGDGFLETNNKTIPLKANDLLVIDSKKIHVQYSESNEEPLSYFDFAIDNLHLRGMPANSISQKGYFLHSFGSRRNGIYANILKLLREFKERGSNYHNKVYAIFTEILVDTLRLMPKSAPHPLENDEPTSNRYLLENTKNYIDEHYSEPLNLNELLKHSFMTKSYFITQFKKLFSVSPMQYLTLVRIEQAKLLLHNTTDSVTQIAAKIGFNSPVYFTEVFSKTVGTSPTLYRKMVTTDV